MPNQRPTQQPLCICGALTFEPATRCSACLVHSHQQRSHTSRRSTRTPPPRTSRSTSAHTALHSAFSCEEEQPVLFPPSLYRKPARSSSRPSRPAVSGMHDEAEKRNASTSSSCSSSTASSASPSPAVRPQDRAGTPDVSPRADERARAYSPMSAGFARLSLREEGAASPTTSSAAPGRRVSRSLDLGARMFGGPA